MHKRAPAVFVFIGGLLAAGMAFGQPVVVNSASFTPGQPVAPGSIASVFGQHLCPAQEAAQSPQLMYTLGGCTLAVNGVPAQLYYVSDGLMNFVVPPDSAPGSATLSINNGAQTATINVAAAGPGVFADSVGTGAMLQGLTFQPSPFSVTSNGSPTPIAVFMTGLDLSSPPSVSVGGVPADVTFYGQQGTYPGMQQINFTLPASTAGSGRVPVSITSGGQVSNVTSMDVLPTTAMIQAAPGFPPGTQVAENTPQDNELVNVAYNPQNNTVLSVDRQANLLRIQTPGSSSTVNAISLPDGAKPEGVAVNGAGTQAAVAMGGLNSVALVDLNENRISSVISVDAFPRRVAYAGNNIMVTNSDSDTVSVIDSGAANVTHTVNVGHGPVGIAVDTSNNRALVANMQSGDLTSINTSDFSTSQIPLPAGTRPFEVGIAPGANRAVISVPTANNVLLMNLADNSLNTVDTSGSGATGPSGVAINGNTAYIANMTSSNLTAMDVASGAITGTPAVAPGPRAIAVDPQQDRMFVMSQGTATVNIMSVGPNPGMISAMPGMGGTPGPGFQLPTVSSVTPSSAKAGTTFTMTISGSNLSGVRAIDFQTIGGRGPGGGAADDTNITVPSFQVNSGGTAITATVNIAASATPGPRRIHFDTANGDVMMGGMTGGVLFTVTAP